VRVGLCGRWMVVVWECVGIVFDGPGLVVDPDSCCLAFMQVH
jgi:hypothetical protein